MTCFRLLVVECFDNIASCFTAVESCEPQCCIDLEETHNGFGLSVFFFISLAVCTISGARFFFLTDCFCCCWLTVFSVLDSEMYGFIWFAIAHTAFF